MPILTDKYLNLSRIIKEKKAFDKRRKTTSRGAWEKTAWKKSTNKRKQREDLKQEKNNGKVNWRKYWTLENHE